MTNTQAVKWNVEKKPKKKQKNWKSLECGGAEGIYSSVVRALAAQL